MNKTSKMVTLSNISIQIAELSNEMLDNEDWQDACFKMMKALSYAESDWGML